MEAMHMSQSTEVGPDAFINAAIEAGVRNGVEALDANERLIFLISEAEAHCDEDGIDSFLDRYRPNWIQETARAFAAVGAVEISAALGAITLDTLPDDPLLDRANELITSRSGYDYDAIRKVVEQRCAEKDRQEVDGASPLR
jgi:hypothetical protein